MRKTVLMFGFIAGGILSAVMLATMPFHDVIGNDAGLIIGYASMVLAFLLIYFGVRSYRDKVVGGRIGFFRAAGVGALIALVASACYVATWEVFYFGGKSDFLEQYQSREVERMRKSGASQTEISAKQREMRQFAELYRNPIFNSAFTFLEPLPVGILFSIVSAGILSRRRKAVAQ